MYAQQIKLIEDIDESLIVNLGGDALIDANLLAETIKDVVNLVEYSKREISPRTNVELKVDAFQPGSFEIAFKAVFDVLSSDAAGNIAGVLALVMAAVPIIIRITKHLGGKKPSKIEKKEATNSVVIHNNDDVELTVNQSIYNIYATPDCNSTVANMFNRLETDGTREDFRIKTKDVEEIVDAKDFKILSLPTSLEPLIDRVNVQKISNIEVDIRKPDLAGRSQWGLYLIKQIDATMEDERFIEEVHNGEHHFGANDKLIVDLRIETILDDRGLSIVGSERYFVEHVHEHVPYIDRLTEDQLSLYDI
ncbi:MAG: hypothetical protein ACOX3P_00805 [Saccharofermentanales bacterium]|jgi:hypothetical protein|nr:hypothetical protein [Clostridiales bacterium]